MTKDLRIKESKTFYNDIGQIWHGEKRKPIYGSQDSIGAVILSALLKDPNHIAQVNSEGKSNKWVNLLNLRQLYFIDLLS